MSETPEAEREVEALARELERGPIRYAEAGDLAARIVASDWYAGRIAQARREALMNAANRVTVATTPTSPTFGAYMHAAQIVRETTYRDDA